MKRMIFDEEKRLKRLIKERTYRIIAVDIDGTLARSNGWKGYKHIGDPDERIARIIRREKEKGSYIIVHTCRVSTADNRVYPPAITIVNNWLKKHKIKVDEIWLGVGKPFANLYFDDSAVNINCDKCMKTYEEVFGKENS